MMRTLHSCPAPGGLRSHAFDFVLPCPCCSRLMSVAGNNIGSIIV